MLVLVYDCEDDGAMPADVVGKNVTKVETKTCTGWVDITKDFTETRCGAEYRFHIT